VHAALRREVIASMLTSYGPRKTALTPHPPTPKHRQHASLRGPITQPPHPTPHRHAPRLASPRHTALHHTHHTRHRTSNKTKQKPPPFPAHRRPLPRPTSPRLPQKQLLARADADRMPFLAVYARAHAMMGWLWVQDDDGGGVFMFGHRH
jgi:hypothetical protein